MKIVPHNLIHLSKVLIDFWVFEVFFTVEFSTFWKLKDPKNEFLLWGLPFHESRERQGYIFKISVIGDNTKTQRVAGHTIRGKVEAHQGMTIVTKSQRESDGPTHGPTTRIGVDLAPNEPKCHNVESAQLKRHSLSGWHIIPTTATIWQCPVWMTIGNFPTRNASLKPPC
jgi:hypothetical protein